jgi:hypothetical protein
VIPATCPPWTKEDMPSLELTRTTPSSRPTEWHPFRTTPHSESGQIRRRQVQQLQELGEAGHPGVAVRHEPDGGQDLTSEEPAEE